MYNCTTHKPSACTANTHLSVEGHDRQYRLHYSSGNQHCWGVTPELPQAVMQPDALARLPATAHNGSNQVTVIWRDAGAPIACDMLHNRISFSWHSHWVPLVKKWQFLFQICELSHDG